MTTREQLRQAVEQLREAAIEEDLRRALRKVLVLRFGALNPGVEARIETASTKELDQFRECAVSEPDLAGVFMTQFSRAILEHASQDDLEEVFLAALRQWDTLGFSDDEVARSLVASLIAAFAKGGRSCDGPPYSNRSTTHRLTT